MAHHKSAQKRIRRNAKREVINTARKNRIRSFIRRVEDAIDAGDKDSAAAALRAAQPEIHRGVNKGILHRNTAARRLSRLSTRINALS
jgi:small subunit ribosomal protein S20